jgi:hypothetical protein
MRLRVPGRRGNTPFFESAAESLRACEAVDDVRTNPSTGSILIFHRGETDEVLAYSRRNRLFSPERPKSGGPRGPWTERFFTRFHDLDTRAKTASGGAWDLLTTTATGLFALSVVQILRGRFLPPAWTLFGDAIQVLIRNRDKPV